MVKELPAILAALADLRAAGQAAVLATLVRVEGSAFRRPGARMLLAGDGRRVGGISGGCLEADVCEHAQRLGPGAAPVVLTYRTGDDGEALLGYGMGCQGTVRVLLERIEPGADPGAFACLQMGLRERKPIGLATVFASSDPAGPGIGAWLALAGGEVAGAAAWPAELAGEVAQALAAMLVAGRSRSPTFSAPRGEIEALLEVIRPPVPLVLFGATDLAKPVVRLAKELGWHVTVCDRRAGYATAERFPLADATFTAPAREVVQRLPLGAGTAAVIMTHHYPEDQELLRALLPLPLSYVGMLGSRQRTQRLLADLAAEGMVTTEEQRRRLHSPVGLDLGAETPEAIALAIVAEIQAVLAGRTGGFLRDRGGPIHAADAPS